MTRHALPPSPAVAPAPRPMPGLAPSIVNDSPEASLAGHSCQEYRSVGQQCGPSASGLAPPAADRDIARISGKPKSP